MDIRQHNYYPPQAAPPTSSSNNGFPIIAISIIGIFATILILVSYYIFVTSCCFRLKNLLNPAANSSLQQPFSFRGARNSQDLFTAAYSPSLQLGQGGRGLDESMIQEIPTFQYCKTDQEAEEDEDEEDLSRSLFKCVVCLNEFQDQDMLRLLPNCNHAFHIDCIDIWLQNNGNCPLCRTSLCGLGIGNPNNIINVIAPNSSPQDQQQPFIISRVGSDEHFVMTSRDNIEASGSDSNRHLGQSSRRKSERRKIIGKMRATKMKMRRFSVMGDECIDVRERRDEQFSVKPIRRSFSMDYSADDDRHVYLSSSSSVLQEEMLRQHINGEISSSSSRRSQRSIFSFGCGSRRSEYAILPI